jgi:sulfatase maturation enzyme AslB (radical SAM superfamily)
MDPDTAIASLRHALAAFGHIEKLQFFGGEPLLNLPVIAEVCRWFEEQVAEGLVAEAPRYSVVTNGTLVTDEAENKTFLRWIDNGVLVVLAGTISPDEAVKVAESLK